MFFESKSARGSEKVVNLFAETFQDFYVGENEPVSLPMLDTLPDEEHESHELYLVQLKQTAVSVLSV
jgi:hypothetical protein